MQEPLYNRILHVLTSEIAGSDLQPGNRLMENRIATRFGVSRAPARKALAQLEALGLVAHMTAPGRGFVVVKNAQKRAAELSSPIDDPFTTDITPTWQRIYGEVEDALTRRIAFGAWRLTETGIARQFGVSRTVARDVLARLQTRGLVVNEGKGWVAPKLSEVRVRDLYELRALLEPAALQRVSNLVSEAQLDQMICDLQGAAGKGGQWLDKLEADLHIGLLQRCDNSALRKAMTEAQSLLLAHKFFYQHTAEIYPVEPFLEEHVHVLSALRKGAVSEACDALRIHLLHSSDRAVVRITTLRGIIYDTPPDYLEPHDITR
ncbi:DNA-binding transcriptional regulator, GntR family [Monaibacterium marinum]|uniref:DNA-binding transcriptional regulator, GntR family n=1 Tax=Pontivivens marinum TaxID=1690039 RepID=A0A2C9CQ15_9RHOB|nr:GntR family transcriptional regulator [Monaibacterium marinum]SOH93328.1 DNA-binding transcriptional regulator, GntR family [Monaibacterium marinum]